MMMGSAYDKEKLDFERFEYRIQTVFFLIDHTMNFLNAR